MKTIISITGPYRRKDGRQHLCVKYSDGSRSTKSYAKYLLEQKLDRELYKDETADHIDENCSNDDPDNIQLLTRSENAKKSAKRVELLDLICSLCGNSFKRKGNHERHNRKQGKAGPFCSRSCAGEWSMRPLAETGKTGRV